MSTTIIKGMRVMEYLAHAEGPRGISEVARDIDLNKSAVQRILNTFVTTGYVERAVGSSKYQLTLSLWELGSYIVESHEARRLLHPILRYGAQATGFTAFLAYSSFPFVVYLDKVEGAHGRAHSAEPGRRIPMTTTAAGNAVMAYLPEADIKALGENSVDWSGHVQYSGTSRNTLIDQIRSIRAQGYATSEGGLKKGVNSVAAPIWWRDERPYGSIVLTADEQNLPPGEFAVVGAHVASMADEATIALGGARNRSAMEARLITY